MKKFYKRNVNCILSDSCKQMLAKGEWMELCNVSLKNSQACSRGLVLLR